MGGEEPPTREFWRFLLFFDPGFFGKVYFSKKGWWDLQTKRCTWLVVVLCSCLVFFRPFFSMFCGFNGWKPRSEMIECHEIYPSYRWRARKSPQHALNCSLWLIDFLVIWLDLSCYFEFVRFKMDLREDKIKLVCIYLYVSWRSWPQPWN